MLAPLERSQWAFKKVGPVQVVGHHLIVWRIYRMQYALHGVYRQRARRQKSTASCTCCVDGGVVH